MSERLDRWKPALIHVGSAFVLGAVDWVVEGRLTVPILMAIAFALGWGWWVSPLRRAPKGAWYIRQFHGDDMVTPTVVAGADQLVAPSAEQVRTRLR